MKNKRSMKPILLSALALLLTAGAAFTAREIYLDRSQRTAAAELLRYRGQYAENSLILRDTSRGEAEKLAKRFGAELRTSFDENFMVLTLPESTSVEKLFSDNANRAVLSKLSLDLYSNILEEDIEETEESEETLVRGSTVSVSDEGFGRQTYFPYLNFGNTWNVTKGKNVTVAVIDTGIDTDHPEFEGKISEYSYNATYDIRVTDTVSESGEYDWSPIEDVRGHGTCVAGVISASMNGEGIVGVAPETELLVIKCEADEKGRFRSSDLIFAVYYAIERDVDVINMSFGSPGEDHAFSEVLQLAVDSDILCIAAAGNNASAKPFSPANDPNVIAVGALEKDSWTLAPYSNYGENSDLVAPGTVYTADNNGGYIVVSGTSVACPQVAGAAALYLSTHRYVEYSDFREILFASCRDLGDAGDDFYYGYGALDVGTLICGTQRKVTFDMLTSDVENIKQVFFEDRVLQNIPFPERNYAVFDGWYYDVNCTEELNLYKDAWNTDITLYAHWANEEDGVPYTYVELDDGTVEIRSYTGKRRFITVPEKIDGKIVSSIGDEAFRNQTGLRRVTLPEGLINIGRAAFQNCSGLFEADIPDSVEKIGAEAFFNTVNMRTLSLSENSRLESIGSEAFGNSALEAITLPARVSSVDSTAFFGCTSLPAVEVVPNNPYFRSGNGVLYNATQTALLVYPAGKPYTDRFTVPESVTTVEACAFAHASVRNIDLSAVQTIESNAFLYSELVSIVLPDSVRRTGSALFSGCEQLREVTLGSGMGTVSDKMFENCRALTRVEIPSQIYSIGERAFAGSGLEQILFEKDSRLAEICAEAFSATGLKSIEIPREVSLIGRSAFSGASLLSSVTFTEDSNLRFIGNQAFLGTAQLSEILLPEGLETVGDEAFARSGLNEVTVPAGIISFGTGVFSYCDALTYIHVAEGSPLFSEVDGILFDLEKATLWAYPAGKDLQRYTIPETVETVEGYAFAGAGKLISVTLPDGLLNIEKNAFCDMKKLRGVAIPDTVTRIARLAFSNDTELTSVTFGENSALSRIGFGAFSYTKLYSFTVPANVADLSQKAFAGAENLHTITFAENSRLDRITAELFFGADNLQKVIFRSGSALKSIQARAFTGLSALQSVDFGDAAIESIGNYAFRFCEKLQSITLPDTVESIGRYAFYGCNTLCGISIPQSVNFIGRHAFDASETLDVYFKATTLPETLQENWDFGIKGYYLGVSEVSEDDNWKYARLTDGGISVIAYKGTETSVSLTRELFGEDILTIGGHAFERSPIESIVLPNTLVTIQSYAFADTAVKTFEIPETVKFIGKRAFAQSAVEKVDFGETPSLAVLEQEAFADCKALKTVRLPRSLETMGQGVFSASGLVSVDLREYPLTEIPNKTFMGSTLVTVELPDTVKTVGHSAFRDCTELSHVTFPTREPLWLMSNAFYNTALESVSIPANLTYIGEYALTGLRRLSAFEIEETNEKYSVIDGLLYSKDGKKLIAAPAGKTGSITLPESLEILGFGAFENSALTKIYFAPESNILTFGYRCFYNASITDIRLPESVISLDYYAFAMCKNLVKVTIPAETKLKGIYEGVFYGCSALSDIELPNGIVEISDFAFYGCSSLKKLPFEKDSGILGIYDYAFAECGLSAIEIPESVIEIGEYAFAGNKMQTLTVPSENARTLTIGLGAFSGCNELSEISVPFIGASFDDPRYTWFGYIFGAGDYTANATYVPESLKHVVITGNLRSARKGAFYDCRTLESIELPEEIDTVYGYAFMNCPASYTFKKAITIRDSYRDQIVSYLSNNCFGTTGGTYCGVSGDLVLADSIISIGRDALGGRAPNLKSLHIPRSVTTIEAGGNPSFVDIYYDGTLEEWLNITVNKWPDDEHMFEQYNLYLKGELLTDALLPVGKYNNTLQGCVSLQSVEAEEGVTEIPAYMFYNCPNLEKISLPDTVCSIGKLALSETKLDTFRVPLGVTEFTEAFTYSDYKNFNKLIIHSNLKSYNIGNIQNLYVDTIYDLFHVQSWSSNTPIIGNIYISGELLTDLVLPNDISSIPDNFLRAYLPLVSVTVTAKDTGCGQWSIRDCKNLQKVIFEEGVETLSGEFFENAGIRYLKVPSTLKSIEKFPYSVVVENNSTITWPDKKAYIVREADGTEHYNLRSVSAEEASVTDDKFVFQKLVDSVGRITYRFVSYVGTDESITLPADFEGNAYNFDRSAERLAPHVTVPEGITNIQLFAFASSIESITLPDSVTEIPDSAFQAAKKLTQVNFGKAVTHIGSHAFEDASALRNMTIPDTVVTIGNNAFANCTSLESIYIPASVNEIGTGVFDNCPSLREISLAPENTAFVLENGALYNKDKTELLWLSLDTTDFTMPATVKTFGKAIAMHTSLRSIRFEDGTEITTIGDEAFSGCKALSEVVLPNRLTRIGNKAFYQCKSLQSLHFPESLTSIGDYAFCNSGLTEVDLSECTSLSLSGSYIFSNCESLTSVKLPSNLKELGGRTFDSCRSLEEIELPDSLEDIGTGVFASTSIRHIKLPKSLKTLGGCAFMFGRLESIEIPEGITAIYGQTFYGTDLKEVIIPGSIQKIYTQAFYNCWHLEKVTLSEGVEEVADSAFYMCNKLNTFYLPSTLKSFPKTYQYASSIPKPVDVYFNGTLAQWASLPTSNSNYTAPMPIQNLHTTDEGSDAIFAEETTTIEQAQSISGVQNVRRLKCPSTLVSIGAYAFRDCTGLEIVELSENLETIDATAFDGCHNIREILLPESNKNFVLRDGILYDKEMTTVLLVTTEACDVCIPNTVTDIRNLAGSLSIRKLRFEEGSTIENLNKSLQNCTHLVELSLPDSLTTFGMSDMSGCPQISILSIGPKMTAVTWGSGTAGFRLFFIDNQSPVVLTPGSGIAKEAFAVTNADGTTLYKKGFENCVPVRRGDFLFADYGEEEVTHRLVNYLGTDETVTLPEDCDGEPYEIFRLSGIKNMIIPSGKITMAERAFENSDVETVEIHEIPVSYRAFTGCYKLISAKIYDVSDIGREAFSSAIGLKSIYLHGKDTTLAWRAFSFARQLSEFTIEGTIKKMEGELIIYTPLKENKENYVDGLLVRNNWLITSLPGLRYAEKFDGNVADGAYSESSTTLKGAVDVSTKDFTNLEILIMTGKKSDCLYFSTPKTLKTIILKESYELKDRFTFNSLPGVTIFVEKEKKDLDWDTKYPGWARNSKVYYGGTWCFAEFRDSDGTILDWHAYPSSEVIRQPAMQNRVEGEYTYVFVGWDLDGDGFADFVPATSQTDIYARAVYEKHRPDEPSFIPATCTENGKKTVICLDCGEVLFDTVLPAFGHVKGDYVETVLPTCTNRGYDVYVCKTCSETFRTDEIAKLAHDFGDWNVIFEASCVQNGARERSCTVCGYTETEPIPAKGHSFRLEKTKQPTCTAFGENEYVCTECHEHAVEKTDKLPHEYVRKTVPKHWLRILLEKLLNMFFGYEGNNIYYYECRICRHIQTADEHVSSRMAAVQGVGCMHEVGEDWENLPAPASADLSIYGKYCIHCGELVEAKLADAVKLTVTELNAQRTDSELIVDIAVENLPEAYFSCLSVYDKTNRMIETAPVVFENGSARVRLSSSEGMRVRLFIWNKTTLAPLCGSAGCAVTDSAKEAA